MVMVEIDYRIKLFKKGREPFWTYYTYESLSSARVDAINMVGEERDDNENLKAVVFAGRKGQSVDWPIEVETHYPLKKSERLNQYCVQFQFKNALGSDWRTCDYTIGMSIENIVEVLNANQKDYPQYNWRIAERNVTPWKPVMIGGAE